MLTRISPSPSRDTWGHTGQGGQAAPGLGCSPKAEPWPWLPRSKAPRCPLRPRGCHQLPPPPSLPVGTEPDSLKPWQATVPPRAASPEQPRPVLEPCPEGRGGFSHARRDAAQTLRSFKTSRIREWSLTWGGRVLVHLGHRCCWFSPSSALKLVLKPPCLGKASSETVMRPCRADEIRAPRPCEAAPRPGWRRASRGFILHAEKPLPELAPASDIRFFFF